MERSLEEKMRSHLESYYSSKGVVSNVQITNTSDVSNSGDDGSSTFTILIYAERIQLPQYHAGSWLSRYTITISPASSNTLTMDGTVRIHAHTFENGNVQMNSTTTLGPITITDHPQSTAADFVANKIQSWEEDRVVSSLHEVYDGLNAGVLKKLRRVMPVTRTKFDWNVASMRLHKDVGMGVTENR